jgi:hypothetical protein
VGVKERVDVQGKVVTPLDDARMAALRSIVWLFLLFTLGILLLKIPVVGRQLTLEALTGWALAIGMLALWPRPLIVRVLGIGASLLTAYALTQFEPGDTGTTYALNWVPFQGQVGTLNGISDILETLWPFIALALAVRWITPWRWRHTAWSARLHRLEMAAATDAAAARVIDVSRSFQCRGAPHAGHCPRWRWAWRRSAWSAGQLAAASASTPTTAVAPCCPHRRASPPLHCRDLNKATRVCRIPAHRILPV